MVDEDVSRSARLSKSKDYKLFTLLEKKRARKQNPTPMTNELREQFEVPQVNVIQSFETIPIPILQNLGV